MLWTKILMALGIRSYERTMGTFTKAINELGDMNKANRDTINKNLKVIDKLVASNVDMTNDNHKNKAAIKKLEELLS
jgi:NAD-dependent DNA ligase